MVLVALALAAALAACGGSFQSIGFDTGSGCEISDPTSTFSTDDPVHYRAYFEPDLQAGDDITVTVSHDGERHPGLGSVLTLKEPTNCIHAVFGRLDPGKYVVSVSSRLRTGMPAISGDFEVTGERLNRAPVGEIWFGSSYDRETFEIEGRTDSVEQDAPLAFVTQFETWTAADDLMLRLSHDGEVVQHERAGVEGTHESRLYGFAGTAPSEPGTWTFDFTDRGGNVLATGKVMVTAAATASASTAPSASASAAPSPSARAAPSGSEGEEVSVFDLAAGDCYRDAVDESDADEVATVVVVDCAQPHVYEAYHVFDHAAGSNAEYPGDAAIREYADDACQPEFEEFVDHEYETSIWYIETLHPSAETWAEGDREIVCALVTENYDEVTGSAAGSAE